MLIYGLFCTLVVEVGIWLLFQVEVLTESGWQTTVMIVAGIAAFLGGVFLEIGAHNRAVRRFEQGRLNKHDDIEHGARAERER